MLKENIFLWGGGRKECLSLAIFCHSGTKRAMNEEES